MDEPDVVKSSNVPRWYDVSTYRVVRMPFSASLLGVIST